MCIGNIWLKNKNKRACCRQWKEDLIPLKNTIDWAKRETRDDDEKTKSQIRGKGNERRQIESETPAKFLWFAIYSTRPTNGQFFTSLLDYSIHVQERVQANLTERDAYFFSFHFRAHLQRREADRPREVEPWKEWPSKMTRIKGAAIGAAAAHYLGNPPVIS